MQEHIKDLAEMYLEKYGETAQRVKLIEELVELLHAVIKCNKISDRVGFLHATSFTEVLKECFDVKFLIYQIESNISTSVIKLIEEEKTEQLLKGLH